jgi:8-oxo-dGTP pyrophosphatase MutT (NUDIX family)
MYTIFINNIPLTLIQPDKIAAANLANDLVFAYSGKKKSLTDIIAQLENGGGSQGFTITHPKIDKLWADFRGHYKLIEAAGGLVYNPQNEVLLIHRLGYWDLPKGKIDLGETPEQASVREVEEETGLSQITRGGLTGITYHTYIQKEKRILKRTYWFDMSVSDNQTLVPQTSEGIDQVVWKNWSEFGLTLPKIYGLIRLILDKPKKNF